MSLNTHAPKRLISYVMAAVVALAVFAQSLAGAAPAHAAGVQSPSYFDRKAVMQRAQTWVDARVPYSQEAWRRGYRTDCSGFVSMAWGLDESFVTWSLPTLARPISKSALLPGDIIVNPGHHVVLFGGWANSRHTAYVVLEEAGTPHKAVKRVVAYPYDTITSADYKPYRYVGGHNLHDPASVYPAPLVRTDAGGGQTLTPSFAVAGNQHTLRIAAKRIKQLRDQRRHLAAQARRVAEAKAAAKAAANAATAKAAAAKVAAAKAAAAKAAARKAKREAAHRAAAKAAAEQASQPVVVRLLTSVLGVLGL